MAGEKRYRPQTMRDYLSLFFRRLWSILIPIALAAVLAIILILLVPSRYEAEAITQRRDLSIATVATDIMAIQAPITASLETLRTEILAWPSLRKVVQRLNMDVELVRPEDWERMYKRLRESTRIGVAAKARGIDQVFIRVQDPDPTIAANLANALGDVYVESSSGTARTETSDTIDFMRERVDYFEKALHKAEDDLQSFVDKNRTLIPEVRAQLQSRLSELDLRLTSDRMALAATRQRLEKIENQLLHVPQYLQGVQVTRTSNERFKELVSELDRLTSLEQAMLRTMTRQHPQVIRIHNEIARLKEQIAQTPSMIPLNETDQLNEQYVTLRTDQMRAQQEIGALEAQIAEGERTTIALETQLRGAAVNENRYADLVREKDKYLQFYNNYSNRLQQMGESRRVDAQRLGTRVDFVARAIIPVDPVGPNRLKIALICLAIGLAVAAAIVFTLEFFDYSLRSTGDAGEVLGVPILGAISAIESEAERENVVRRRLVVLATLGIAVLLLFIGMAVVELVFPGQLWSALQRAVQSGREFFSNTFR